MIHSPPRQSAPQYQVSLTAGTILHNTKTPLTVWFWAAYLAVTDKRGISALLLQRQLGLSRYETAWMLLHKLRRAMVNAVREPLHGDVEIDDTWVGVMGVMLISPVGLACSTFLAVGVGVFSCL